VGGGVHQLKTARGATRLESNSHPWLPKARAKDMMSPGSASAFFLPASAFTAGGWLVE
jgi:hypothetical protein